MLSKYKSESYRLDKIYKKWEKYKLVNNIGFYKSNKDTKFDISF